MNIQSRCLKSLVDAKLEHNANKELRKRVTEVMYLFLGAVGNYLDRILDSYSEENAKLVQQAKLEKLKLRRVEKEITEAYKKYRDLANILTRNGCSHFL